MLWLMNLWKAKLYKIVCTFFFNSWNFVIFRKILLVFWDMNHHLPNLVKLHLLKTISREEKKVKMIFIIYLLLSKGFNRIIFFIYYVVNICLQSCLSWKFSVYRSIKKEKRWSYLLLWTTWWNNFISGKNI